jgi:hypothetical protein
MTPGSLFRLGGWLLGVGALVSIVTAIAGSMAYALSADQASPLWLSIQIVGIVAALCFSLGLPAVYFYQAYEARQAGLWGFILTETANSLGNIGYSLVVTIVTSTLSATVLKQDQVLVYGLYALSTISSSLLFVGTGLFGFATLKGKVFPRNAALLLLVGCVISLGQVYPDPLFSVSIGLLSQVCSYSAFLWMASTVIRESRVIDLIQQGYVLEQIDDSEEVVEQQENEQGSVEEVIEQHDVEQSDAEEVVGQHENEVEQNNVEQKD